MNTRTSVEWKGDMLFEAELLGQRFYFDSDKKYGGQGKGLRPKPLLLSALAGCTGMDVVSILKKMRIEDYKLNITVEAEQTEEHPKIYRKIYLNYNFRGKELPEDKIKKAVELSETRYCGVSAMLKKSADIIININIESEE
ncbi:MAG: OsmC family protein [Candidatus Cloacimonetes bacterium]|nr:OsmC family protein [Candidatus Cloacimonadota bacterium]